MEYAYKPLDGFTYHIAPEPTVYLREWLEKEWGKDAAEHPDQPWTREWLGDVRTLEFRLEVVEIDSVRLRADLMAYHTNGYSFHEELAARVLERTGPVQMGTSIMPLVVRARDRELMDGYTRSATLKQLGAKKVYAYVGYPSE